MYGPEKIAEVAALAAAGFNISAIARASGVSRPTIRDWLNGRTPSSRRWDRQCRICGAQGHDFAKLPNEAYAYLLAMYLGDGSIVSMRNGVLRLRITLDNRYPGIIEECATRMHEVMPENSVLIQPRTASNCSDVGCYSKQWPCLLPQHAPGRKHLRPIRLTSWQEAIVDRHPEQVLRGFIHSDGCRHLNRVNGTDYPRYMFDNRSVHIRGLFCDACDRIDIPWTWSNHYTISVARARGVKRLDEFVGPKA